MLSKTNITDMLLWQCGRVVGKKFMHKQVSQLHGKTPPERDMENKQQIIKRFYSKGTNSIMRSFKYHC